jgi:hypothetical protein
MPYRLEGHTFAISNFHIEASRVQTGRMVVRMVDLMHVRPDHTDWRPDFWISIAILPYGWAYPDRDPHRPDGCSNLPISMFWKEILRLDRTLRIIRTGCWIVWTDASWSSSKLLEIEEGPDGNPCRLDGWYFSLMGVRTVCHVIRMADALDRWASEWFDTSSRRLVGNWIFWFANCAESSGNTSEKRNPC